jgi:ABC-2 type transport system permease protein
VVATGFVAVVTSTGLVLAGRRDLGAGILPADAWTVPSRPPSTALQLALRTSRGTLFAWSIGASALAALLGSEAQLAAKALADSPAADKLLTSLGGTGGAARAYLGLSFSMFSLLAALVVAGQLTSARREESSGRLDHILARPAGRAGWLCGRASLAAAAAVLVGLLAGLFTWAASLSEHLGIAWSSYMGAGLNTVAPAIALLGIGLAVFGWRPQFAAAAIYGLLVWSFLAVLLAGALGQVRWLLDLSVFHYVKPAPAQAPDVLSAAVMVAVGVMLAVGGTVLFQRRDLVGN